MTPLLTGIYTLFSALPHNTFYNAIGGRLYHANAPQEATFPYCVVESVSHEYDWNFTDTFESVLIQFSIFTEERSASNIGVHWNKLATLFDDAAVSVSGYNEISMIRQQSRLLRDIENNIWQYVVEYECFLEKS